ncbi:MAG: TIGR04283 family arsenosugar biosynthesis glycosyltransferase [Armatimonadetes bacterium]|nr:TIGR04283 family arsenosugar biosynthesis glycosyltransferase [Armatimonadota bacterium]
MSPAARVGIIIPTLDEAGQLPSLLAELRRDAPEAQLVVADGGSADGTKELVKSPVLLVESPPGRALQMNAGAARCDREVLVFLHADTRLPSGALGEICERLDHDPDVVGGMLGKEPFGSHRVLAWADAVVDGYVRRVCPVLLGDRAIFVRTAVFRDLGGFRPLRLMEDPDLGRRLARRGRLAVLPARVRTSDRRFVRGGVIRTLALMTSLYCLFLVGVPTGALARFYPPSRE